MHYPNPEGVVQPVVPESKVAQTQRARQDAKHDRLAKGRPPSILMRDVQRIPVMTGCAKEGEVLRREADGSHALEAK